MAGDVRLGVAADVQPFTAALKSGVIAPLEDAADAVKKLSNTDTDKLERGFKETQEQTKDAKSEIDKLQRSLDDLRTAGSRSSRQVGDDLGENVHRGSREASEGLDEVGESSRQNAIEVAASFDGSAQSISDGFQGLAAEVFAGFGPAGVVAGVAAAAGIGLISQAFGNAQTNSEAFKQSVNDDTTALIEAGSTGKTQLGYISDSLKTLATGGDQAGVTLDKLFTAAKKSGGSATDLALAYAGNTDGLKNLIAVGKEKLEQDQKSLDVARDQQRGIKPGPEFQERSAAMLQTINDQKSYNSFLETASTKAKEAAKNEKEYAEAGGPALEAKAKLIENIDSAYTDAAGAVDDYVDSETGIFDTDKYIAALQKKETALKDYSSNLVTASATLSPQALAYIEAQGADAGSILVKSYIDGTTSQRDQLNQLWSDGGKADGQTYVSNLTDKAAVDIPGATVHSKADDSEVQKTNKKNTYGDIDGATVHMHNDDSSVQNAKRQNTGGSIDGPNVRFKSDTTDLDRKIQAYTSQGITIPATVLAGGKRVF